MAGSVSPRKLKAGQRRLLSPIVVLLAIIGTKEMKRNLEVFMPAM